MSRVPDLHDRGQELKKAQQVVEEPRAADPIIGLVLNHGEMICRDTKVKIGAGWTAECWCGGR